LRYLPSLDLNEASWLHEEKWQKISTQERISEEVRHYHLQDHIRRLKELYPGWTNLSELYWRFVHDRTLSFPGLPGQWMAVEAVQKPALGNTYEETEFAKVLGFETDRFHASWNDVTEAIERKKALILEDLGLAGHQDVNVRLLEALEWNLLGNREGWGQTNTYEWTNTLFCRLFGYTRFLIVGSSAKGGVGSVSARSPVSTADDLGFRAAVVFEESKTGLASVP
jgi:hypothetical protein